MPPPLSIRAGVLARFERLATDERAILLYASVIGRSFDGQLLERVTGTLTRRRACRVGPANELQLVADARWPGLVFRHAITREILVPRDAGAASPSDARRARRQRLARRDGCGSGERRAPLERRPANARRASAAYELAGDAACRA